MNYCGAREDVENDPNKKKLTFVLCLLNQSLRSKLKWDSPWYGISGWHMNVLDFNHGGEYLDIHGGVDNIFHII